MNKQIHTVGFDADQKLLDLVEKKVEKLTIVYDRITTLDIYFKLEEKSSHIKDKTIEIKINVPGNEIFVKETSKSFEEILDKVLESAKRQLIKHKEKLSHK